MYRFVLSWRWLGAFLLALVVAAGCVFLGHWQWDRRQDRLARNAVVTSNYDREPAELGAVLLRGRLPPGAEWTPVRMSGTYLARDAVLVRNRPLDGRPGYHSLVPFQTDDGRVLLVDRGWLPVGQTGGEPAANPAPPSGQVRVVARLRPAEPLASRQAPQGQTHSITPEAIPALTGVAGRLVGGAYGVLGSEDPPPGNAPRLLPKPELDEGPHLSYALQWFVFAIGALVGFVVIVRRTAEDDTPTTPRAARPRRPTAEEEEDALVDAQLARQQSRGPGPPSVATVEDPGR